MGARVRGAVVATVAALVCSGAARADRVRAGSAESLRDPGADRNAGGDRNAGAQTRGPAAARSQTWGGGQMRVEPERIPRGADLAVPTLTLSRAPLLTGRMLVSELDELANEFGTQLGALTLDLLDLEFDLHRRRARVVLNSGSSTLMGVKLDGNVRVVQGVARVDAAIDLRLGKHALSFAVPTFELVPQSLDGQRWIELRLPLIEQAF